MMSRMPATHTCSSIPCLHRNSNCKPFFGLVQGNSRPVPARYSQARSNEVSTTPCSSQREEGSVSLLTSQSRQPYHTSDSGPTSTSSETRPTYSMVGSLCSQSNNAVTRSPHKAAQVISYFTMRCFGIWGDFSVLRCARLYWCHVSFVKTASRHPVASPRLVLDHIENFQELDVWIPLQRYFQNTISTSGGCHSFVFSLFTRLTILQKSPKGLFSSQQSVLASRQP